MKLVAFGKVNSGQLRITSRKQFDIDLSNFDNKEVVITIEKKKKTRSIFQNRYYWGVVVPVVKDGLIDIGYKLTTNEVHAFLKGKFNIIEIVNEKSGEILKSIGSTSEMSTSQMMDYFAQITQWASEYLSIQIPQPNEQLEISI